MERLGVNGYKEVKNHLWLQGFNWESLKNRKTTASFIPNCKEDNFDPRNILEGWRDDEVALRQNLMLLEDPSVQAFFKEYYFDLALGMRPCMPERSKLEHLSSGMSSESTTIKSRQFQICICLLYTSPSPRDLSTSRMPSSA
eukprot:TRINITY_DN68947_c0_g1_i1.p1 TRINITY_DN68947_c0_g1~~TRINITY_DN68947_c0_g1_i1.p1  ORF type:complete len:142 (-),score=13.39 TRINITY_DN68947_c0_g1_i1:75-500(-)